MPLCFAVVERHDLVGADARLSLAGADGEAEALRDDGGEVGQLFDVFDDQGRGDVGESCCELGSQLCKDPWGGKKVDSHDLGYESACMERRGSCFRTTHT